MKSEAEKLAIREKAAKKVAIRDRIAKKAARDRRTGLQKLADEIAFGWKTTGKAFKKRLEK